MLKTIANILSRATRGITPSDLSPSSAPARGSHGREPRAGSGARRLVVAKFDSAKTTPENRKHWANADGLSPNAAINPEVRRVLRNRARYEVANNSYAKGIVLTLANDTIGTGPRLQMLTDDPEANARIEDAFEQWSRAVDLPGKLRTMRLARAGMPAALVQAGYTLRMSRPLYIALSSCLMLAASSCNRSPKPTVGPAPSAANAAQLSKIQGRWTLSPVRQGAEPLPFDQLSVTVQGTVVSGSVDPGNVAFQGTTEHQQPRPGGGRLRLTAHMPSTAGEITMIVDWCEDAREGNGGWFAGAGLKDTLAFVVAPKP